VSVNRGLGLTGMGDIVAGREHGERAMADEQPAEFTAKIVAAYVRGNQVPPDQLASLISTVHQALAGLGKAAVERTPAVPINRSVHHDHVVCLECGWRGQMLRRHVTNSHGLTLDEYRARWKLPANHALTAPGYSQRRAALAKQLGLGGDRRSGSSGATKPRAHGSPVATSPRQRGRPRSAATFQPD
jgi:predicted transcriptional regulator